MSRAPRRGARRDPARRQRKPPAAVELTGVEKSYGDARILGPIDLRIGPGCIVAVVGHNGSGKSTLLTLVAGVVEPSEGKVRIHGAPPDSPEARAAVSYLPDDPVLYDDLSVSEHLEYVGALHALADRDLPGRLLERLGLGSRGDDIPRTLSRGLRQRAALAVGLCRPFAVLLIDEPFVGLDAAGRRTLVEVITEAREEGATVVVATHEPSLLATADRCVALADGRVVFDGAPGDLPPELAGSADELHGERAGGGA